MCIGPRARRILPLQCFTTRYRARSRADDPATHRFVSPRKTLSVQGRACCKPPSVVSTWLTFFLFFFFIGWKKFHRAVVRTTALSNLFDNLIGKFIQIFRRRCAFSYRFDISLVPSYSQLYLERILRPRGSSEGDKFLEEISYNCKFTVPFERRDCILKRACIRRARDRGCCWQHDATRRGVESRRTLSLRHLAYPCIMHLMLVT